MSQNFMKMYDRVDQIPPKGSTQAMTALLLEVQTALAKYAREKEMPLEQLLGDDSESSKKAIGINISLSNTNGGVLLKVS